MKLSTIRARALLLALLPASAVALVLLSLFLVSRLDSIEKSLHQRGATLVRQLAVGAEYGVYSGNRPVLQALVFAVMAEVDVRSVSIWNPQGGLLASVGELTTNLGSQIPALNEGKVFDQGDSLVFLRPVRLADAASDDPLLPAFSAGPSQAGGWVAIEMSRVGARAAERELVVAGVVSVLAVLSAALLLAVRIGRGITRPLERTVRAVQEIGSGDYAARVPVEGGEDLRRLGEGVNRMAARIEAAQAIMQREIEAATRELREKRAEAEQSNVAKTRFLAAASHDLRQPIHALGLFVELLSRKLLDPDSTRLVMRIGQSVEAISSLLDSLLDISRLDSGAMLAEPRKLPVQLVLDRLADAVAEAESKGLRLRIRASAAWISSDPLLLERVLRNLLANAIRYTESGAILVGVRRRSEAWRFEVRDSGIGIAPESQGLIFHEFVQLANPERNRDKGLGLGLAIVARLGRLLGHPIGLRSAPGKGSVFWVDVPAAEPEVGDITVAMPEGSVAGRTIVLVDDDPLVLASMSGLLENWGCLVFAADSGAALSEQLAASGRRPDLIICDHSLANGERGGDVVVALRHSCGSAIPAILMSGDTDPELAAMAARLGLPMLYKPVRPARLRATLRSLISPDGAN